MTVDRSTHTRSAVPGLAIIALALLIAIGVSAGVRAEGTASPAFPVEAQQVELGKAAYARHCALCHGDRLEGMDHFPTLVGTPFQRRWGEKSLGDLYTYVFETMPLGAGSSLEVETYAAIIAFLLERNGAELTEIPFAPEDEDQAMVPLHFGD
jgi:cytochrome c